MKIVFFTHPPFLGHQSMPRFAQMLADGMRARGHQVEMWTPQAYWFRLPSPVAARKWFGYIDQYLVFPAQVRSRVKNCPPDTLFVFTDQALGPWVPLVADRPHVIHCHDFLAQEAALGRIAEQAVSWTGKQYQAFIRRGYAHGKHFISVSHKTQQDLHRLLPQHPVSSEIVYNGLNQPFRPVNQLEARSVAGQAVGLPLMPGYLLHVGGNQWYKNRRGVIELYNAWRGISARQLPLILIGESPDSALGQARSQSPYQADIHFLTGMSDETVRAFYSGATAFLFPSLAEGFGWPIAEAMASGCPVITTDEAPMTEVAGKAAYLIPKRPHASQATTWAARGAKLIDEVVELSKEKRAHAVSLGLRNAARFDTKQALDHIEGIYERVIAPDSQKQLASLSL